MAKKTSNLTRQQLWDLEDKYTAFVGSPTGAKNAKPATGIKTKHIADDVPKTLAIAAASSVARSISSTLSKLPNQAGKTPGLKIQRKRLAKAVVETVK